MPQYHAELKCPLAMKIPQSLSFKFIFLVLRSVVIIIFLFLDFIVMFVCLQFINIVYLFLCCYLFYCFLRTYKLIVAPITNQINVESSIINIRGLYNNIKDLKIACYKYDIILCSEILVSNRCHISEISIPGFNNPTLLLIDSKPRICAFFVSPTDRHGITAFDFANM